MKSLPKPRFIRPVYLYFAGIAFIFVSCKGSGPAVTEDAGAGVSQTPVQVTQISNDDLTNYIELNATTTYLQKNFVKANSIGYINSVSAVIGHYVNKGELLFTIQTKEAKSIGSSINILDTTFKFSGINKIRAAASGYVTQLSHQQGDYVQDGEQLAVISDRSSFVFLVQLPYELKQYLKGGQTVQLTLPGGTMLDGNVSSFMPSVDTASQTQGVVIRTNSAAAIPENLVAKARIVKTNQQHAISLPKAAILSNETQTTFWVMRVLNDSTAVKTIVTKGIESGDRIEITSPKFTAADRIVISGNYGLADTAKIKIMK